MAEVTRRRQGELVRGVFRLLRDHPDGLAAKDVLQQLRAEVPPTASEASEYPDRPGVVRYDKLVRFATIPAVKAGWMGKAKGIWSITEEGTSAYDALPRLRAIHEAGSCPVHEVKEEPPYPVGGRKGDGHRHDA